MIKLQNAVVLNSKLYSDLFGQGGDELIAVYSLLRFHKRGKIKYKNEGKLTGYKLLHNKTKLSLTTLKKYVPQLIELNLCRFDKHNQLFIIGTNKINKLYTTKRPKLVPIEIGTYKQTKLFSFRVRILRMEQNQKNRIDRRDALNKIIGKRENKRFLSKSEFAMFKAMRDIDWDYYNSGNFEANTVLSNQGYSKLKGRNSGAYWKKELVSAGIIKTKRNIRIFGTKRISKETKREYISGKISEKWMYLVYEDVEVTSKCCDILKKAPVAKFEKETGLNPIIGVMASESSLRKQQYNKTGTCNVYGKRNICKPLSIFTEEDVWAIIDKFKIEICPIYYDMVIDGEIVKGEERTGCAYCAFGVQYEDPENTKFHRLSKREPNRYRSFMDKLGYRRALAFLGLKLPE